MVSAARTSKTRYVAQPSPEGPPQLTIVEAATLSPDAVLARLASSSNGLSAAEVAQRQSEFGPNALGTHQVHAISVLLRQLRNPILILLLLAALVSELTGGGTNAVIIAAIVALSVGLSFFNEFRAEVAMSALRAKIRLDAEVRRDGQTISVAVTELVPGDVVSLRIGTLIPADLRLLEVDELECDEAVLTGESLPVEKWADATTGREPLDQPGCAFMGTIVHQGSATAVVVETGTRTAFGVIAAGLSEKPSQTEALLFSLAIAVGIAPEMMPAIVTVSLSAGAKALVAKKVLVKRLVAIEDLGNIEILFTDKTGTLTDGVVTFQAALDPAGQPSDRARLLGLVCNEATLADGVPVGGNALDQALWLSVSPGATPTPVTDVTSEAARYRRIATIPFDHERQLASVLVDGPDGRRCVVTKGAPEEVLKRCVEVTPGASDLLEGLFSQDRPKDDASASIKKLEALGVEVKIITGDNGLVAKKVCADIGLECRGVLTGAEVQALSDEQLTAALPLTTVFARIGPEQKSRIIKVARRSGKDVGFLGDGVNDAVALHHADVGISVDSGTDVAKDAADVVLLDKDLGVLADGVMEGRRIFANTMKYVLMATSSNFGNMFSAAGASAFLTFLPMLPSQILLNNLLYNAGQLVIPTDLVDPEALARPAAWGMASSGPSARSSTSSPSA